MRLFLSLVGTEKGTAHNVRRGPSRTGRSLTNGKAAERQREI